MLSNCNICPLLICCIVDPRPFNLRGIEHKLVSVIAKLGNDSIFYRIDVLNLKDHGYNKFRAASWINSERAVFEVAPLISLGDCLMTILAKNFFNWVLRLLFDLPEVAVYHALKLFLGHKLLTPNYPISSLLVVNLWDFDGWSSLQKSSSLKNLNWEFDILFYEIFE